MATSATQGGSAGGQGHQIGRPSPRADRVSPWVLWFGLSGAFAAWTVQLLVSYPLASHACFPGAVPLASPAFGGLWTILLLISLAALAVGIASVAAAWHAWQRTRAEAPGNEHHLLETGEGRSRFMALSGVVFSGIIVLVIVLHGISLFLLPPCG